MQKYQDDRLKKKNRDFDNSKQSVTLFVSSLVGFLQVTEYSLIDTLDRAELAVVTSLNNIVNQLDGIVNVSTSLSTMRTGENSYVVYLVDTCMPRFCRKSFRGKL